MTTETTGERTTLADILASGYLTGFEPGPRPGANPENTAIDEGVCREETCDCCGHRGLRHRPWHSAAFGKTISFAVCPACFHAVEF